MYMICTIYLKIGKSRFQQISLKLSDFWRLHVTKEMLIIYRMTHTQQIPVSTLPQTLPTAWPLTAGLATYDISGARGIYNLAGLTQFPLAANPILNQRTYINMSISEIKIFYGCTALDRGKATQERFGDSVYQYFKSWLLHISTSRPAFVIINTDLSPRLFNLWNHRESRVTFRKGFNQHILQY